MIQKREVISHTPMRSEWLRMKKAGISESYLWINDRSVSE